MEDKGNVVSIRLPGDLDARLAKAAERVDLSKADLMRHAVRAAIESIEAHGTVLLPLRLHADPGVHAGTKKK